MDYNFILVIYHYIRKKIIPLGRSTQNVWRGSVTLVLPDAQVLLEEETRMVSNYVDITLILLKTVEDYKLYKNMRVSTCYLIYIPYFVWILSGASVNSYLISLNMTLIWQGGHDRGLLSLSRSRMTNSSPRTRLWKDQGNGDGKDQVVWSDEV